MHYSARVLLISAGLGLGLGSRVVERLLGSASSAYALTY